MLLLLAATLPLVSVSFRTSAGPTPLAKVISLLENLKLEVEADGQKEASNYNKFSCFCKDNSTAVSENIVKGQDSIEILSATMEDKTALKAEKQAEHGKRQTNQEVMAAKLDGTKTRCMKEAAEYAASDADLTKAISSLMDATSAVETSKTAGGTGLVAVKQSLQKSQAIAAAMKLISDGPKWNTATAFLQSSVDPKDPTYKFHSQPLLNILADLEANFRAKKSEADAEFAKMKENCDNTVKDLGNQMSLNSNAISGLTTEVDGLAGLLATTRGSLVQAEAALKDDQLYMKDLTAMCEQRSQDWDQRSQLRAGELEALSGAIDLLKGNVTQKEVVNERALLQKAPVPSLGGSLSFLQGQRETARHARGARQLRARGRGTMAEARSRVLEMLRQEGGRLDSMALSSLAVRATADPFLKVKTLIQRLIERLLSEATSEATKKGFCDTELSKATQDRTFRFEEARTLNAELRTLEAKESSLGLEVADLESSSKALSKSLSEATKQRADEKGDNLKTIKTAQEGLKAVTEAIMILKTFYKQAAKADVLVQVKASPVAEDTDGPGFEGAYQGKQKGAGGILGLLEVIKSDFMRTLQTTKTSEKEAAATFVELDRSSRADLKGRETKVVLNSEELDTTRSTIQSKMDEMQQNMDLVDKAVKEIEALKPMCIDNGMSYKERVEKREKEVEALRKAFCMLDGEGVEKDLCSKWGLAEP